MYAWKLPTFLRVGGRNYKIRTDYRAILDILAAMNDPDILEPDMSGEEINAERIMTMLQILYIDFESMPTSDWDEAAEKAKEFIDCGIKDDGAHKPRLIDWEQDAPVIVPAINKVCGKDVRSVKYMYAEYDRYKSVIAGRPKKCAWWEARYGLNDGIYRVKHDCHRGVDLHQYTSSGICPGIPDEIDVNRVTGHGKSLQWFKTPKNKKKEETMTEKKEGCFSINKNADNISEFLHNRGYGAGRHNLSMIAAANYKSKEVRNALFELAQKGNLIKPAGLNKGWKDDSKKD